MSEFVISTLGNAIVFLFHHSLTVCVQVEFVLNEDHHSSAAVGLNIVFSLALSTLGNATYSPLLLACCCRVHSVGLEGHHSLRCSFIWSAGTIILAGTGVDNMSVDI